MMKSYFGISPFSLSIFITLKKRGKGGGYSCLPAQLLVLERNLKSRPDRKGLFDSFSRSQCEAFGVNSASSDLGESQLCCCGPQSPGLWIRFYQPHCLLNLPFSVVSLNLFTPMFYSLQDTCHTQQTSGKLRTG